MAESSARFSGARLRISRSFVGLSQVTLAERVLLSSAAISQFENGARQPSGSVVERLAEALGFETTFFFRPTLIEFREDECRFRKRNTASATLRNRVLAAGTLFGELVGLVEAAVALPTPDVPHYAVTTHEDIEKAAELCRMRWGLGLDVPVVNVVRVVEHAGVVVARFDADAVKIDAFSRPGQRDVIILNCEKGSTSRARYDVSHECGHLVMHRTLKEKTPEQEEEAERFASAFLMPRGAFAREFPKMGARRLRLEDLIPFKTRWRCSLAAIVRRAYGLKIISALQYQQTFKQYYARGFNRGEPAEPPVEEPEALSLALGVLREHRALALTDVAGRLGWRVDVALKTIVPSLVASAEEQRRPVVGGKLLPLRLTRPQ